MSDIIMRYEDYLIHTKHASDNTVASYMRDLRQYASYLGSEGVDVLDADQAVVSGYMGSMKAGGKSAATISRALASIKSLYIFAIQIHEIEENPIQNIKIDKAEKKLPQILSGKEVELLLDQADEAEAVALDFGEAVGIVSRDGIPAVSGPSQQFVDGGVYERQRSEQLLRHVGQESDFVLGRFQFLFLLRSDHGLPFFRQFFIYMGLDDEISGRDDK